MSAERDENAWAIRPVIYQGRRLERGERFAATGDVMDRRLAEEHYIQLLQSTHSRYACTRCERAFVGGENYAIHLGGVHGLGRAEAVAEANTRPSMPDLS